jgi:hypothetical protein
MLIVPKNLRVGDIIRCVKNNLFNDIILYDKSLVLFIFTHQMFLNVGVLQTHRVKQYCFMLSDKIEIY